MIVLIMLFVMIGAPFFSALFYVLSKRGRMQGWIREGNRAGDCISLAFLTVFILFMVTMLVLTAWGLIWYARGGGG